ncbi:MAG: hypothetical protein M1832_002737 [Thelocarpon impressellum]|nr:MAG: hypothetical protein M1832_002737 [Thelocarpon impressellum]
MRVHPARTRPLDLRPDRPDRALRSTYASPPSQRRRQTSSHRPAYILLDPAPRFTTATLTRPSLPQRDHLRLPGIDLLAIAPHAPSSPDNVRLARSRQRGDDPSSPLQTPPPVSTERAGPGPAGDSPNLATAVASSAPMGSMPDPSSFTARRSAASNLPNFQLPPPELSGMQKFPPLSSFNPLPPQPMNGGGNLLTPPTNVPGDVLSPISSSGVNSGSSASSNPAVPPYTPLSYWPPPGQAGSPYGYGAGSAPGPLSGFAAQAPSFPGRSMLSPSLSSLQQAGGRNSSNSPTTGEGLSLPPPPYDLNLPPFPTSMPMSAPGAPMSASLPDLAVQQRAMNNALMSAQTPGSGATTQPSPVHAPEPYQPQQRLPPTPSYYNPGSHPASAPAHQTSFPNSFTGASPTQQSPSSAVTAPRISPLSAGVGQPPALHPAPTPSAAGHYSRPISYSLPAMSGPIMSNVHSPGSQMSLVGGMPGGMMPAYSGHGSLSQMYGAHAHAHAQQAQQQQQNDRPFKCDQCPQSFNRNHDLKRHKRIHLAVKPFPCGHCEKSFSRKDALKRHILVKGCGKLKPAGSGDGKDDDSLSPHDKSDAMSSDEADDGSPVLNGGAAPKAGDL